MIRIETIFLCFPPLLTLKTKNLNSNTFLNLLMARAAAIRNQLGDVISSKSHDTEFILNPIGNIGRHLSYLGKFN